MRKKVPSFKYLIYHYRILEDDNPDNYGISNFKKNGSNNMIPRSAWIILFILGSIDLISTASETMIIPAIPDIIEDFGLTYSNSSWILSSFLISGAVMTPIAAKLSIIYGRKKVLLLLIMLYIIGTLSAGFSPNMVFLIISRIIQGLSLAIFPIAFGIIQNVFPKDKLAIGQGIIIALFSSGSVIGLVIGGYIIEIFGWQTIFLTIIPFVIFIVLFIYKKIDVKDTLHKPMLIVDQNDAINNNDKTKNESNHISKIKDSYLQLLDLRGTISLAILISSFLIILTSLEKTSFSSYSIIVPTFILLAISCFILFIWFERKTNYPIIPLKIFKDMTLVYTNIFLMISGLTTFMIYQMLPILVQNPEPVGFHGNAITVVQIQLPFMISLFIISTLSGFIVSRWGNIKPTILGSIIGFIGFLSILLFHDSEISIGSSLVIVGVGISLMQVGGFNIITTYTPKKFSDISVGVTSLLFIVGMSIGPAISASFLHNFLVQIEEIGIYPSLQAYDLIFFTAVMLSLIPLMLIFLIKKRIIKHVKSI